ncbi:MAG: hypothetical protein D6690_08065 [Nitrospirae bacterium]|nr:MAG: hypothetical protein D6690_08065 [Nitrospirota bacterium]
MERRVTSHTEEEEMNQRRRLLALARKGDQKAIDTLFELYQVRIYTGDRLKKVKVPTAALLTPPGKAKSEPEPKPKPAKTPSAKKSLPDKPVKTRAVTHQAAKKAKSDKAPTTSSNAPRIRHARQLTAKPSTKARPKQTSPSSQSQARRSSKPSEPSKATSKRPSTSQAHGRTRSARAPKAKARPTATSRAPLTRQTKTAKTKTSQR